MAALLTAAVILLLLRCGPEEQLPTELAGAPAALELSGVSAPPPPAGDGGGHGGGDGAGAIAPIGMGVPASDASTPAVAPTAAGHTPRLTRSAATAERIEIGRVAAVRGAAAAGPPGATLRPLDCGDPVFAGEHAYTASESRLGLLSGDVYIQLAPETELTLALTDAGALDLGLEGGQTRVVDARSSGPAGRLSVMGGEAALLDNDAEARLYSKATQRYGMLCARGAPLKVVRDGVQIDARSGECVVVRSQAPLLIAEAPQEPVAFPQSAEEECRNAEVIGVASQHFTPFDVAANRIPEPFDDHPDPPETPLGPCEKPGAMCGEQFDGDGSDPPRTDPPGGGGDPPGKPPKPPKGPNPNSLWMGPRHQPRGQIGNPNSHAAPKFAAPNCCPRLKLPRQRPNRTGSRAKKK